VPVEKVSRWLGHANAGITQRVYAHVTPVLLGRESASVDAYVEAADKSQTSPPAL
jgi:integrase